MRIYNSQSTKEKRRSLRKNQTDAENKLWLRVRNGQFFGLKFYRQYGISEYIADFYCPKLKLAIELDGGQHFTDEGRSYDKERDNVFQALDIRTLRFSNIDILKSMGSVLERIEEEVINSSNSP